MEEKIETIKEWLGTGSINIFGLPMSGKDTQGIKLAEKETKNNFSKTGALIPTNLFYEWVLPYFERPDLFKYPLVLSSIGRWHGEEDQVMSVAAGSGHEIKAVIILNISEADVERRFDQAKILDDRGEREDDKNLEIFKTRVQEFHEKTLPVIQHYNSLGLLIEVNGDQSREAVFNEIVEKLYQKASLSHV